MSEPIFKRHPLPWRWKTAGETIKLERGDRLKRIFLANDQCVVDADGYEVLGSSQYLRVDVDVLRMLVETVNERNGGGVVRGAWCVGGDVVRGACSVEEEGSLTSHAPRTTHHGSTAPEPRTAP